jgi:hypothetical protein
MLFSVLIQSCQSWHELLDLFQCNKAELAPQVSGYARMSEHPYHCPHILAPTGAHCPSAHNVAAQRPGQGGEGQEFVPSQLGSSL